MRLTDKLLVLVELLQVVRRHSINTMMLGSVDVVLVTQDADGHARTRDTGKLDGARETLVTLGIIVLQPDLELDCLKEVALLGLGRVLKKRLDVRTHSGDCDFRHDDSLPRELCRSFGEDWRR